MTYSNYLCSPTYIQGSKLIESLKTYEDSSCQQRSCDDHLSSYLQSPSYLSNASLLRTLDNATNQDPPRIPDPPCLLPCAFFKDEECKCCHKHKHHGNKCHRAHCHHANQNVKNQHISLFQSKITKLLNLGSTMLKRNVLLLFII